MAQIINVHPENPQARLLQQTAEVIRDGGLIALPTDSAYALCGHIGDVRVLERIRSIRGVDERHHFTLLCRDLSEIANFARVSNTCYRLLKAATPGSYTFILTGSRELPRRVLHPKRKTVGLRIPAHKVALALLQELNEPLLSSTLIMAGENEPLCDAHEIDEKLGKLVDVVINSGPCSAGATTVINLTSDIPELVRAGRGDCTLFGFDT